MSNTVLIADDGTPYHAETREALDRLSRIYGGGIVEVKA